METNLGTFYQGDCLELMKELPDNSVDMILADLPYETTKCKWDTLIPFEPLWEQYNRIAKINAAMVFTAAQPFTSRLIMSNINSFKYTWVWDKVKGTGFLNAKKQPLRNHEDVVVFYRKQCVYNPQMTKGHARKVSYRSKDLQTNVYGNMKNDNLYDSTERYPRSIQVFSTDTQNSSLHPTQKPVSLFEYLIKTYTNEGDVVLDNVAGSGTTAIAAENTNRRWICMELEEEYYNIATKRIRQNSNLLSYIKEEE